MAHSRAYKKYVTKKSSAGSAWPGRPKKLSNEKRKEKNNE